MRKLLVSAAFVFSMALGVVAGPVHNAAAAPSENANCVAQTFQPIAQAEGRTFGGFISGAAQELGGIGQEVGPAARTNNCA